MSQDNFAYPYPVLTAYADDVLPALEQNNVLVGDIVIAENGDRIIPITLKMENEALQQYIAEGYAEYMLEIRCASTLYRQCITSDSNEIRIVFPRKQVAGVVTIRPFVIAKESFAYQNKNFHPDYGEEQFDIDLGDVLAIFNEFTYDFEINYNQLKAFSSIMHIRKAADENARDIRYLSDEDKIVIELPADKFEQYNQFKADPQYTAAVHASLVQNALLAVLMQDSLEEQEENELLWKRTIRYRIAHEEELQAYKDLSNPENIVQLSHKLLGDPIQRMFNDFAKED